MVLSDYKEYKEVRYIVGLTTVVRWGMLILLSIVGACSLFMLEQEWARWAMIFGTIAVMFYIAFGKLSIERKKMLPNRVHVEIMNDNIVIMELQQIKRGSSQPIGQYRRFSLNDVIMYDYDGKIARLLANETHTINFVGEQTSPAEIDREATWQEFYISETNMECIDEKIGDRKM